ncbi:MAG: hypothetical protein ACYS99_08025, partial [Planctomycetota bacterium]
KHYWGTTFFVAPEERRSGVGSELLKAVCETGRSTAVTKASPSATATLRSFGSLETFTTAYFEMDLSRRGWVALPLRSLRKALTKLGAKSRFLDRAVFACGRLGRRRVLERLRRELARGAPAYRAVPATEIPDVEAELDVRSPVRFDRDRDFLMWMMENHWVTTDPAERTHGFFFDDLRESFEYRLLDIEDPENRRSRGFAILWLFGFRGIRELHVLDHHFHDPADAGILASLALEHAISFLPDRVFLPAECRSRIESSRLARRLFEERERTSHLLHRIEDHETFSGLSATYADGDIAFG